MGNANEFNPSTLAGLDADPAETRAGPAAKLYGKRTHATFESESPPLEPGEIASELQEQDRLFPPRGRRGAGSGGGQ